MSLSFDLIEARRRAVERQRRWRESQRALLGWAISGFLLFLACSVIAYGLYGFFFL